MVIFSNYITPLDRDYGRPTPEDISTDDVGIGVKDIGWGLPMGIGAAGLQDIAAKMKQGAGALEIQFPGAGAGQRTAQTPGMYGKEHRQALKELAEIAEVNLTTHASFGIGGLSGMDRYGNFSPEYKKFALNEIKRAIEFAADVADGGPVVVHSGEFPRPISDEPWAKDPKAPDGYRFIAYKEEPESAVIGIVDKRTGRVFHQVRKGVEVATPKWKVAEKDYTYVAETDYPRLGIRKGDLVRVRKGDYVDYLGRKVAPEDRVPDYDPETGRFKIEMKTWKDFEREAEKINKEMAAKLGRPLRYDEMILPEEVYVKSTLAVDEAHAKGWALEYARHFDKYVKELKRLEEAYTLWKKEEEKVPPEKRHKLAIRLKSELEELGIIVPREEKKLPSELIKEKMRLIRREIEHAKQASTAQEQQAKQAEMLREYAESSRKYALRESYGGYAEAGLAAWEATRRKKTKKPIFVAIENLYPENYGGHPEELRNLVKNARKVMEDILVKRGLSRKEARDAARTHIKITLDTGHLNMWRKYWHDDPKKSVDENDAEFKKWMLKEVEQLAKEDMIGNVHLSDNFGYQDEHLIPGTGIAPVKEIVETLRKYGYKGPLTVEAGAAATTEPADIVGLYKTWRLFGSPVYAAHYLPHFAPKRTWTEIQYSYFGQTQSPYFVVGPYAPSEDWTLWSRVPLE